MQVRMPRDELLPRAAGMALTKVLAGEGGDHNIRRRHRLGAGGARRSYLVTL
jgi:hypothetical protein